MDLEAIQQGLATAAKNVAGLNAVSWIPAVVNNAPAFFPIALDFDAHVTFSANGLKQLNYTCAVVCSAGDQDAGRIQLQKFLSSSAPALIAALEADKTLGGACAQLVVARFHSINDLLDIGGTQYFSAQLDVTVWAT
jgi:hypothetical protein